jgi:exopolysaccharide biosynthesis protein
VECLAALLPRAGFAAAILDEPDRAAGYSAVVDLARSRGASVAVNGGFFTFNPFTPDGLLLIDGKTVARARADYSGAIAIDGDGVLSVGPTAGARRATFAVQGHPTLVENGGKMGMQRATGDRTARTFVAQSGETVIVAVTSPVTLYHLADALVQYPDAFGLRRIDAALNLSGAATTSFYARLPDGSEVIRKSSWPNRDVLIFEPRSVS